MVRKSIQEGTTAMGFCSRGERSGSTPNKDMCRLTGKEQGGGQWMEHNIRAGGLLLAQLDQILAEGR